MFTINREHIKTNMQLLQMSFTYKTISIKLLIVIIIIRKEMQIRAKIYTIGYIKVKFYSSQIKMYLHHNLFRSKKIKYLSH